MATSKKQAGKKFEISKIGGILDNISKSVPIIVDKEIKDKEFISTGNYLLNASLSGSIWNGISTQRITAFAGESGSGKTYISLSICKNAQKKGYTVIYIDTEYSIDLKDLPKYGVDNNPEKFTLIRTNKVEDINITLTQLLDELKEAKVGGYDIPKLIIVLDSLGQLASNKEKGDLLAGNIKQDMTRSKSIGSMFRSINIDLGYLEIPMIVANHTYMSQDSMFPTAVMKGGMSLLYSASVVGFMTKAKLKTGEEDDMDLGASGITVLFKTQKNRLAKPKKIRFDISFVSGMNPYSGLDAFCRPEYFDTVGVAQGKMEVDKSTGEMVFKAGGNRWYVKHLGKSVTKKQLLTKEVFTQEVLENLEPIINNYFRFKDLDEIEKTEEEFNKAIQGEEEEDFVDDNGFADADDMFG